MHGNADHAEIPNRDADFQIAHFVEPSLAELLADPLTRSLMKADRVDVEAFEMMIRSAAERVRNKDRAGPGSFLASETTRKSRPSLPTFGYRPRSSRAPNAAAAQSMHGLEAIKAAKTDCGSHCLW
jgi:hypothetical protein